MDAGHHEFNGKVMLTAPCQASFWPLLGFVKISVQVVFLVCFLLC